MSAEAKPKVCRDPRIENCAGLLFGNSTLLFRLLPSSLDLFVFIVELKVMICESFKIASIVIRNSEMYPQLEHIVLMDDTEFLEDVKSSDINLISFKELEVRFHFC